MSVELRASHDLGEIVGYGFRVYRRHFLPFFLIALVNVPLAVLLGVIQARVADEADDLVSFLFQIPIAIVQIIATSALVFATHQVSAGKPAEFGPSLDAAFERFAAVFGASLLGGLRLLLSLLAVPFLAIYWLMNREATIDGRRDWYFAVVPLALCVYLIVRWQFVPQSVMIAGERGWAALDDSSDAVRGSWWRTLGIIAVLLLMAVGVVLVASPAMLLPPLPAATISGLAFAVVLPFYAIAQTLLYYDLKARRHAADSPDGFAAAESDVPGESA